MKSLKKLGTMAVIAIATMFVSGCEIDNNYYGDDEFHRSSGGTTATITRLPICLLWPRRCADIGMESW